MRIEPPLNRSRYYVRTAKTDVSQAKDVKVFMFCTVVVVDRAGQALQETWIKSIYLLQIKNTRIDPTLSRSRRIQ